MADDKALLVAFAEWYGQAYAANFIPKGTIDAFLSTRQPPGEPVITLGCEHGRLPGHPCPHCMGINEPGKADGAASGLPRWPGNG